MDSQLSHGRHPRKGRVFPGNLRRGLVANMFNRREFMTLSAAALTQAAGLGQKPPVRFGVDLYSIRSQGFDAFQHLDYCAKLGAKVVHFSEIQFMGSLEEDHLKKVRAHAEKLGVEIEMGMRSICPRNN
jgi:hypothetical protein